MSPNFVLSLFVPFLCLAFRVPLDHLLNIFQVDNSSSFDNIFGTFDGKLSFLALFSASFLPIFSCHFWGTVLCTFFALFLVHVNLSVYQLPDRSSIVMKAPFSDFYSAH